MPSNAELIADIDALSTELGQTVNVTGLKNDQLAKLLSNLRDEKAARASTLPAPTELGAAAQDLAAAAATLAPASGAPAPDEQAAAAALAALMAPVAGAQDEVAPTVKPYYVAPGKAITSKIGILDGDIAEEVKAEYFEGGDETLQTLIESGYVIES